MKKIVPDKSGRLNLRRLHTFHPGKFSQKLGPEQIQGQQAGQRNGRGLDRTQRRYASYLRSRRDQSHDLHRSIKKNDISQKRIGRPFQETADFVFNLCKTDRMQILAHSSSKPVAEKNPVEILRYNFTQVGRRFECRNIMRRDNYCRIRDVTSLFSLRCLIRQINSVHRNNPGLSVDNKNRYKVLSPCFIR